MLQQKYLEEETLKLSDKNTELRMLAHGFPLISVFILLVKHMLSFALVCPERF